jgi:hypothetical protein
MKKFRSMIKEVFTGNVLMTPTGIIPFETK